MTVFQAKEQGGVCQPQLAPKRIGVLLYPGVEPMDFQGPSAMFDLWHLELGGPQVVFVAQKKEALTCAYGRLHIPQFDFADLPTLDALLVPGGRGRHEALCEPSVMAFLAEQGSRCDHVLSVCTGVFLLISAGLAAGKRVTTHREFINELVSNNPSLRVERQVRYTRDGKLWTAAGILAGIDLALAFIDSFEGSPRPDGTVRTGEAKIVQSIAQYNLNPR